MIEKIYVTIGGYALAALLLWAYIDAKSDIKAEQERCNSEKLEAVAEARRVVRDAEIAAMERHIDDLTKLVHDADQARLIAEEAAELARNKPAKVRTVIREVASANACIDTAVPAAVINSLR